MGFNINIAFESVQYFISFIKNTSTNNYIQGKYKQILINKMKSIKYEHFPFQIDKSIIDSERTDGERDRVTSSRNSRWLKNRFN